MVIANSREELESIVFERAMWKDRHPNEELPEGLLLTEAEELKHLERALNKEKIASRGRCLNSPAWNSERDMTFDGEGRPEYDDDGDSIDY